MGASKVRIAAAGDVHAALGDEARLREVLEAAAAEADLVLLAGDLTAHGDPLEARELASACAGLPADVVAVLGNHDWHLDLQDELARELERAEVTVLQRGSVVRRVRGVDVGIAGTKGFVGGFPGASLPDFGERLLRDVYAESAAEVRALGDALSRIAHCPLRIVLLHYSPSLQTLRGEPEGIWAFLGDERLAGPVVEYRPDLVLHGHAHAGQLRGAIGSVPVYNVALPLIGGEPWVFELEPCADPVASGLIAAPDTQASPSLSRP